MLGGELMEMILQQITGREDGGESAGVPGDGDPGDRERPVRGQRGQPDGLVTRDAAGHCVVGAFSAACDQDVSRGRQCLTCWTLVTVLSPDLCTQDADQTMAASSAW